MVAMGGNALLRGDQEGTIDQQEQNTSDTLENLIFLLDEGYDLVISHGNGPQIGNILMRNEAGEEVYDIPRMPVDICVADSQGGIGYMIERMLRNVLKKHGIEKEVVTLVTMVEVDQYDPAFREPVKRIGRTYTREQARALEKEKSWVFRKSSKSPGFRRVVPSPAPVRISNEKVVQSLARQGTIVIAAGGGGIPVYLDENLRVRPAEVVIDKDLASSLLAARIGADEFYILTDVPYVYLDYGKETQHPVEFLDHRDTLRYLEEGQFSEGSMAPKIKACLQFIEQGGRKSVITEASLLEDKKYGTKITMLYED